MISTFNIIGLPQTYGLFIEEKLIGMFQFTNEDLEVRPDIFPWLACFYIDKEYRNQGMARILLEKIIELASSTLNYETLYLFTKHKGFYEKFGWDFVSEIDTEIKEPKLQRLYKLNLKNETMF